MSDSPLIGIDPAKNIFRINCLDENGKRIMNKSLRRESVMQFFAPLSECAVAMEACASAHYWGRAIESLGHTVRLIDPRYVAPCRLGDKNDAAAICAAAQRPDMRFVRLRSQRQSDVQALHRVRALLAEDGIVVKQGPTNVFAMLPTIVDDASNELSGMMR